MNAERMVLLLVVLYGVWPVAGKGGSEPVAPPDARPRPPAVTLRQPGPPPRAEPPSLHPPVKLLDAAGKSVLHREEPLSLKTTCGACHDVDFIERSNYHRSAFAPPPAGSWTEENFARWDPLVYRRHDEQTTAAGEKQDRAWLAIFGPRHVGGGQGIDLELNCLLCHARGADNPARLAQLREGRRELVSSATLPAGGLAEIRDGRLRWRREKFDGEGRVAARELGLSRPTSDNCRLCHGRVCRCSEPVLFENSLENWSAETTGTVFSPARMLSSGMNLRNKEELDSPWDVHAERLLGCADCHFAPNNPALDRKLDPANSLSHLAFDARRISRSDYLWRPDHNLATGYSARLSVAEPFSGSMRNCADCHRAESEHAFLPFRRTHFAALGCAACHVPRVYTPVRQVTDWTLLLADRAPKVDYDGVQGPINDPAGLIEGVEPVLLRQKLPDGGQRLQPHTLLAFWFWVEDDPPRPLPLEILERALFDGDGYRRQVVQVLDGNNDGRLDVQELRLNTESRVRAMADILSAAGAQKPRLRAELRPHTVSHGVLKKSFALRDCTACHHPRGRLNRERQLARSVPAGAMPFLVGDGSIESRWEITAVGEGLIWRPLDQAGFFVHGASRPAWVDAAGKLLLVAVMLGVMVHAGLRWWFARRRKDGRGT